MRRASVLLLLLLACAHAPPAPSADPFDALLEMEETRSLQSRGLELATLARTRDAAVRGRALEVIARLQRPELVDAVVADLGEDAALERAAFAAGQLGLAWRPLPKPQLEQLEHAVEGALRRSAGGRAALLEALGKLGQPRSAPVLLASLADPDATVRASAAIALGALARATNGATPDASAVNPLGQLLADDADAQVRFAAAYALMRMKRPEARPALTFGIKDGDARVRALCARGLADVATAPELPYLFERLDDPDLDVRVEAARALAKLSANAKPLEGARATAAKALAKLVVAYAPEKPSTAKPLLALVQDKLVLDDVAFVEAQRALAPSKQPADQRGRAVVACYLAAARDRLRTDATTPAIDACAPTGVLVDWREALAVRTLADDAAAPEVRVAKLLSRHFEGTLAAEAVDDALGEAKLATPDARARVLRDLRNVDWGVVLSAAAAAGKLGIAEAIPELHRALTVASVNDQHDAMGTILLDLAHLNDPDALALAQRYARDPRATVRFGALDALEVLHAGPATGPVNSSPRPGATGIVADWSPLPHADTGRFQARLEKPRVAHVVTERGEIQIRLREGSFTAENFVELARDGFYDQLTFHRVVPGFVAQGGDPRGDGAGGPGYTIPCEIDAERYVRGAVGMALAGKDTGGSQFFITLTPQPHLEGRYTIFGNVISGMDVADSLLEGDRILSIRIE